MDLTINGKPHKHAGENSIDALVLEIGAHPDKVAVLVNNEVVPRSERGAVSLNEGDNVEIIKETHEGKPLRIQMLNQLPESVVVGCFRDI